MCIIHRACSWLLCSVYIERTTAMSSAHGAVCGMISEYSTPQARRREFERRAQQVAVRRDGHQVGELLRHRLAVALVQLGLGIEQIHVAGAAVLKELDHGSGSRRMMRPLCGDASSPRPRFGSAAESLGQQRRQAPCPSARFPSGGRLRAGQSDSERVESGNIGTSGLIAVMRARPTVAV